MDSILIVFKFAGVMIISFLLHMVLDLVTELQHVKMGKRDSIITMIIITMSVSFIAF